MKIIVPISGGKDSQVVLSLALDKHARADIVCVHQNTGFDHPLTYAQLAAMSTFYGVEISHTVSKYGDMFGFLEHARYFPNSSSRGCTQRLKQEPFAQWLTDHNFNATNCEIWFGMRADESAVRADKYGGLTNADTFELSDVAQFYGATRQRRATIGAIRVKLPIVNWNTDDVFAHLKNEGAPINALYRKGHVRVGCYPCLLARKAEWQAVARDPVGRRHLTKLLDLEHQFAAEGNPRKFIKVHRVWPVAAFLDEAAAAPLPDLAQEECGYCSI